MGEIFQNELGANPAPFNAHHILPIGKLLDTPELQELMLWASKNGRLADLDFNNIDNGLMVQRRVNSNGIDLNGHGNHPKYDEAIKAKIIKTIENAKDSADAFDKVLTLIENVKKKLETEVILETKSVNEITNF